MENKYPTVNYIGNKNKLSEWIIKNFPIKHGTVLDLFCGGCSISYALKNKGFTVHANDSLYSNYVLAKAIIENKNECLKENIDFDISEEAYRKYYKNTSFLINKIYYPREAKELSKLLYIAKSIKGYKKYLFLALIRRAMIRKIPYSRMNIKWEEIKKFRNEEYSYKKYGRYRHYHNISFQKHIELNMNEYNKSVFDNNKDNKAYHCDCFSFLQQTNNKYDAIYIDPPYPGTMNKYGDFYGSFDKMFEKEINYIDITSSDTFLLNFEKLIKLCSYKSKYAVISMNQSVKPSPNKIINMLKKYGKITTRIEKHQYRVTGKKKKNKNKEMLIIVEFK